MLQNYRCNWNKKDLDMGFLESFLKIGRLEEEQEFFIDVDLFLNLQEVIKNFRNIFGMEKREKEVLLRCRYELLSQYNLDVNVFMILFENIVYGVQVCVIYRKKIGGVYIKM